MTIDLPLLVVVAGPTAVGKTTLSVSLACHFETEVISSDSRQFYREMSIGTAVPDASQLKSVKHHFIHHLSIHDSYNVSKFESDALGVIGDVLRKHPVAVMVGGSGLYINSVCEGIDLLPDPDPAIRRRLKEVMAASGIKALQQELSQLDPDYARQIDMANPARLIRAIEICHCAGVPYSSLRTNSPAKRNFRILKLGIELPRAGLYKRINDRVDEMMASGLYHEALGLFPYRHLNALNTVGYKELFDHFEGLTTLEHAVEKIKTHSRRYAKRQLTWFKRDSGYTWFHPGEREKILALVNSGIQGASRSLIH